MIANFLFWCPSEHYSTVQYSTVLLFKTKLFFFSSQKREDFLALTDAQEKSRNRKCLCFLHTTTACAGKVGWCEAGAIWISPLVSWFSADFEFQESQHPQLRNTGAWTWGQKKKKCSVWSTVWYMKGGSNGALFFFRPSAFRWVFHKKIIFFWTRVLYSACSLNACTTAS